MVRRRHVIYVQGYDPRGLAEYYRMFRGEFRKFLALYGLKGEVARVAGAPDRSASLWSVNTQGRDWHVDTTYEFLRWEDIIRRDFERPMGWAIVAALHALLGGIFQGGLFRVLRAHWRFGLFILYPYVLLLGWFVSAGLVGTAVAALGAHLGIHAPLPALLGIGAAIAAFLAAIRFTEPTTYMLYLFQDAASTAQYARRQRTDWEERLETFAGYVIEAAQSGAADEIVVVGHSSGSFLAVDVLTRALARDPDLGRHGPRVVLLTIGANLPIVGFHRGAQWFRDLIARLAFEPSIDWVDYQSRRDVMNFFPFNPVTGHRIEVGDRRLSLTVVPVQFRDVVSPERFAWLRWHFFSLHFQFLRANEKPNAYDYFMIVAGPFSLPQRVAMPREVTDAVAGDESAARAAWQRIAGHPQASAALAPARGCDTSTPTAGAS